MKSKKLQFSVFLACCPVAGYFSAGAGIPMWLGLIILLVVLFALFGRAICDDAAEEAAREIAARYTHDATKAIRLERRRKRRLRLARNRLENGQTEDRLDGAETII